MATLASFLSSPLLLPRHRYGGYRYHHHSNLLFPTPQFLQLSISSSRISLHPRKIGTFIVASSSTDASFEELNPREDTLSDSFSKKSDLSNLIQEIEPLDVSLIQKDVPLTTVDAMKRTISGMLGLLPSNQFQVHIEALWEPLSKLLISSMMTGYTLRNAEYRLCMERNLDIYEQNSETQMPDGSKLDMQELLLDNAKKISFPGESALSSKFEEFQENTAAQIDVQGLGEISHEAQEYILHLQSRLSSAKKELHDVKRKNAALQMQQFVGEEKNDLLDYLRSLQPEKVAELSEPTSPELKETIHSVVYGLLATLSPRIHSKAAPASSDNVSTSAVTEDGSELLENTSLHFQPLISLTRDYLARLLFWCMLLGHYLRGLEYRLELVELLSLSADEQTNVPDGEQIL